MHPIDSTDPEDLGVNELARLAGLSSTTVSRKLRAGKSQEEILAEAETWHNEQEARTQRAANGDENFTQAQARKEIALADLRELELATKRGELVPLEDVNEWIAGMILTARDVLLRIAPELRDSLARETSPAKIHELIEHEVHRALTLLSEFKSVR